MMKFMAFALRQRTQSNFMNVGVYIAYIWVFRPTIVSKLKSTRLKAFFSKWHFQSPVTNISIREIGVSQNFARRTTL